ncbi:MAG: UDP-N-acetylglucosamine-1-phosphate transferase [Nitrososphaera sp.]
MVETMPVGTLTLIEVVAYALIAAAISFGATFLVMPRFIRYLVAHGRTVQDYHKKSKPLVPRPAGPVLMLAVGLSEAFIFAVTSNTTVLAILLSTTIAFLVGYVDDRRVMPGWFKPVALLAAAIPMIVLQAHGDDLNLIFGHAFIPLLYIPLILVIIPITGNTINSIDVLNGVASGFVIIASIPLLVSIALFGNTVVLVAAVPLLAVSIAFYKYHKFPSKIFPGDSGTLLLGVLYGALAIAGKSEIIGVIALLPAVMNSFLFLASVKKVVEHREVERPTMLLEDYRLAATKSKNAPATLVRLILADGPLDEKTIGRKIFGLAAFSSGLAFISIVLQSIFVGVSN